MKACSGFKQEVLTLVRKFWLTAIFLGIYVSEFAVMLYS